MNGWSALRFQWFKDFQAWIFITLSLLLFQFILIVSFKDKLDSNSQFTDILSATIMGARFDGSTATVLILFLFLASISTAFISWGDYLTKIRYSLLKLYIVVATLLFGMDIVFFYEYGDQFNQTIFGLIDDDTSAILITVWKEYHPIRFIFLASISIMLMLYIAKKWMKYTPDFLNKKSPYKITEHPVFRVFTITLIILSFIIVARGSTLSTQPLRQRHAFISNDMFLNKTIINPLSSLRYALQKRMRMQGDNALTAIWPEKDLTKALKLISGKEINDIDLALTKTVKKNKTLPKHIFLVVMESQGAWPIWPEYRDMKFSPQLSELADKGIYFKNFIPSGSGTMPSLNAIITGFPYSGLNVNYEPRGLKTLPSSIAATFKRMGYRTRFYYGGYLGWQRLDNFTTAQGFDEIFGGSNIKSKKPTNEWGVDDEYLFEFVKNNVDKDIPSFNVILTTSNHPPYDLDLDQIGFTGHKLRDDIKATKSDSLKVLGHLWYADKQVGNFVKSSNEKFDKSLFAITGDHTTRLQLNYKEQAAFQHVSVPFILYGPTLGIKPSKPLREGSHIDMLPTLYELSAPKGFQYQSVGNNLLDNNINFPAIGSGYNISNGIFYLGNQTLPLYSGAKARLSTIEIDKYARAAQAISWYRIRNGNKIHPGNIGTTEK